MNALLLLVLALAGAETAPLRVCADPVAGPVSTRDERGFENRIARIVADELGRPLVYDWMPQRRGFVRKSIGEGRCDVFIGVPAGIDRLLTTRPYYRSSYVFVDALEGPPPRFGDARLPLLRIGVQLPGDDGAATPPGHALVRAGAVDRVRGFPLEGNTPSAQRIVDAIAAGALDAGVVWGPQVGALAADAGLRVSPAVSPDAALRFEFAIAMGVGVGEAALRDALDAAIERRRADIDAVLAAYRVPRTDREAAR